MTKSAICRLMLFCEAICQLTCIRASYPYPILRVQRRQPPKVKTPQGNPPVRTKAPNQPNPKPARVRRSNVVMQGDDGSAPRHQYYANCDLGSGTCPSPSCVASLGAATDAGTECRLNTGCTLEVGLPHYI